jgi:hypothetical protein
VAAFDALYFHMGRLRLHARPETQREHALHTANACLFPVTVYFLYCGNFGGWALLAGVGATVATFALEVVDVVHEKRARAGFGGVSGAEGALHFAMGVLRAFAFAFALAGKPLGAFLPGGPMALAPSYPGWVVAVGRCMFVASLPMAALHLVLLRRPRPAPAMPSASPPRSLA